ncbi:MAG: glycosyltransferase family 2 protein [Gammaproteobacteria bacterium]
MTTEPTSQTARNHVPVSVIIPCYCCADTIGRAVDSVMAQTALPSEVLLVDDASPDEGKTRETLEAVRDRHKNAVRFEVLVMDANGGPAAARNMAWDSATQEFIAFLDADDVWHPRKLEIQYGWMAAHPSAMLSAHAVDRFGDRPEPRLPAASQVAGFSDVWRVSPGRLLWSNCLPTRSVMLRRELPYRFDAAKRRSEDYLLWLQLIFDGQPAWRLELPLASSFSAPYGEAGLTKDLWNMEKGELDTFRRLRRQGRIGAVLLSGLAIFSLGKFARRWIVCLVSGRL